MTTRLVMEFDQEGGARSVVAAIEAYQLRLRSGIDRSRRRLTAFEDRYGVTTRQFLENLAAEDLAGGDMEYVEWAGEARLLESLEDELRELDQVRYELPGLP